MYSARPDDGQRNCPKHVKFYSKNKLEKLVHLVGFIIRICHVARSSECQMRYALFAIFCQVSSVHLLAYVLICFMVSRI